MQVTSYRKAWLVTFVTTLIVLILVIFASMLLYPREQWLWEIKTGGILTVLIAVLLLAVVACNKPDPCAAACRRVAACAQEARDGAPLPGEKMPPPDARCLKRCREQPAVWASCEQKMKNCADLRACFGPLR